MPLVRFDDAPRTKNIQGHHVRHSAPKPGSIEILIGRTTKEPGPCQPYVHKHDHEDIIVMLKGFFTIRVGREDVTLREGDTLIIPPDTIHTPIAAGHDGCELIEISLADRRTFRPDGAEIGVGFESLGE